MINDKDGHITLPQIMITCTALHHALLEYQKNQGVHPEALKSKVYADRPDRLNYLNHKNESGKIAPCCAVTGRKMISSLGAADTNRFFMNTCNTLLESNQQRVYKHTLATVKHQIKQAENPTPAMVIGVEAAHVDNAILLDYLTSAVVFEDPEIRRTDQNILIDHNSMDDELHFRMPVDCGNY
jgi:hypothetical protein